MTFERPDWLTEPCPAWCDGEHAGQHLEDDRCHHSDYRVVPIIQQQRRWPRPALRPGDDVEAGELNVLTFRSVGARETWIAIANDQQKLELTHESACRLHAALGSLLRDVSDEREKP
ncbi:DUF6907 domain-containing protein [Microbacterium sp.]|uniref:DUF6907 domain-containing protein n=1 Tax=Microbacterium sp. TaxID=51671 RepID=UPI0039E5A470